MDINPKKAQRINKYLQVKGLKKTTSLRQTPKHSPYTTTNKFIKPDRNKSFTNIIDVKKQTNLNPNHKENNLSIILSNQTLSEIDLSQIETRKKKLNISKIDNFEEFNEKLKNIETEEERLVMLNSDAKRKYSSQLEFLKEKKKKKRKPKKCRNYLGLGKKKMSVGEKTKKIFLKKNFLKKKKSRKFQQKKSRFFKKKKGCFLKKSLQNILQTTSKSKKKMKNVKFGTLLTDQNEKINLSPKTIKEFRSSAPNYFLKKKFSLKNPKKIFSKKFSLSKNFYSYRKKKNLKKNFSFVKKRRSWLPPKRKFIGLADILKTDNGRSKEELPKEKSQENTKKKIYKKFFGKLFSQKNKSEKKVGNRKKIKRNL